jgi:LAO/AO transport system ATPase
VLDALLQQFARGDRMALSRLLTFVARGQYLEEIRSHLQRPSARSRVVAITGSAGVGKSTLVGRLIDFLRGQQQTVAVLACDPQSPLSGGALLGDRFRMTTRPNDDGVFIRSLAAESGHSAVAPQLGPMTRVLEAFGFDVILLETVGAGQGDTVIRDLADVLVLLLQPEAGDDIQWEKAGLLEIADIVVIHKADLPAADQVEAQVRAALELSAGSSVPVLRISSRTGKGVDALWQAIVACTHRRDIEKLPGRELLQLTQDILVSRFGHAEAAKDPHLAEIIAQWQQGKQPGTIAAFSLVHLLEGYDRQDG